MKAKKLVWGALVLLPLLATFKPAPSHAQSLTIDNFTGATPQQVAVTSGSPSWIETKVSIKTASPCDPKSPPPSQSPIGCSRYLRLYTVNDPTAGFGAPAMLQASHRRLLFNSSIRNGHRIEVIYGIDERNQVVPLNLDLSGFKKFRIHFDSSDLGLNINLVVHASNNPVGGQGGLNIDGVPTGIPFVVDIPFTNFGVGAGEPPDFKHINQIWLIIQSASAIGGNDYAITSIEAVP